MLMSVPGCFPTGPLLLFANPLIGRNRPPSVGSAVIDEQRGRGQEGKGRRLVAVMVGVGGAITNSQDSNGPASLGAMATPTTKHTTHTHLAEGAVYW